MINEIIKKTREDNGFTQASLAKKLGLSRSAINAWEMGISVPSTQFLVMMASIFSVSCDYLLGINAKECIDVSSFDSAEKQLVYSLVNYIKQKHEDKISDKF